MNTAVVVFLIIGGLGALILALGLLGLDFLDIEGPVPVEAIAAMLGAFGFAAAVASASLDARNPLPLMLSAGVGVLVAIPAGWFTLRLTQAARQMPTDATPVRDDLIGLIGTVVTPVPADGYGEVRVMLGGQPVKLYATADRAIPTGAQVFVITAPSETSVLVEQLPDTP